MSDVRPAVEPMSDLSWARVERGLWARLDGTATTQIATPRSRRWLWIAVPSLAVAAAAAAAFAFFINTPALPSKPVATSEEAPTRIVTGGSPSTITVGDAHVTLDAETAVVMPRTIDGTSTTVIERGSAWFAIAPRTGHQFVVVAGDTVVRVIGTKFRVARFEEHATVEVERGLVDVTFHGATVKVAGGQTWSSDAPQTVGVKTAIALEPAPEPALEPALVPSEPGLPRKSKHVAKTAPTQAASDDERSKYEHYTSLETKDPKAALAGYLEISRGTSRWAEISLFAAARLAADRGEPRAKTLLEMYLRRFPRARTQMTRKLLDRSKGAP
ncbi:MAG: FecR family protein [Kofleriaceae bacterium]